MKYCDACKVNVNENLKNCPLCGSYLKSGGKNYDEYERDIEPLISYPVLKARRDSVLDFLRKKSWWLTIIAMLTALLVNLLFTRGSMWSAYVVVLLFDVQVGVLSTLYKSRRLYALIGILAFLVPFTAFVFDAVICLEVFGSVGNFGISLEYVVPAFFILAIIACDTLAWCDRSQYKYYLLTMWMISFMAIFPQPVVWICKYAFNIIFDQWLTLALFVFSIVNFSVITVVYWKKLQKELVRKFFL